MADHNKKKRPISLDLSENEVVAILLAVKLLNELVETLQIGEDKQEDLVPEVMERLEKMVDEKTSQITDEILHELLDGIGMEFQVSDLEDNDYSYPMYTIAERLPAIEKALSRSSSLDIEYYSMEREEVTERRVDPYALYPQGDLIYLVAFCHLRDEIRVFRVDRIKSLKLSRRKFKRPADLDLESFRPEQNVETSD